MEILMPGDKGSSALPFSSGAKAAATAAVEKTRRVISVMKSAPGDRSYNEVKTER
jgi:hypothetical protein